MRVVKVILGILLILLSGYCMLFPFATQLMYAYLMSIVAGVIGIIVIIDYLANRKRRRAAAGVEIIGGGIALVGAIIAVLFMIFNISIPGFTFTFQSLIAIFLVIGVMMDGIVLIISAFANRYTGGSVAMNVILGVLLVAASVLALGNIPAVIGAFGIFFCIGMFLLGFSMLISGFSSIRY